MKLTVDTGQRQLTHDRDGQTRTIDLYCREAFEVLSEAWLKVGWNEKYIYTFSWMGRPVIQLPSDMVRMQEVIYRLQPEVILETGIAHGGSLVFYASLCQAMGRGRVIGIDIEIRPHNLKAIEAHELFDRITLIEGDSVAPEIVDQAGALIQSDETVLVVLDSCHTKEHVLKELEAYHRFVTPGSYIVATDGIMSLVADTPRGRPEWFSDNPTEAAAEFAQAHPEFVIEPPGWPFNESELAENITHWPGAWLRKR